MIAFSPSDINIASQPFRRERAQNAALAATAAALTASLLVAIIMILHGRAQAADLRKVIAGQRAQLAKLQQSQAQYSQVLSKPGNADVFAQSILLNDLIARRTVSWTRVFQDLGTVLPTNMRLLSIRLPQVAAENGTGRNRVQLDMWVGTEQPASVIALLQRLEGSKLFGDATMISQNPPTQNNPLYQYRLTVAYAQQL
jgi:hypothetical protein